MKRGSELYGYMPALDGLRAVSILLVLISHAWLGHIVPGGLGVTIFFFISGFIITTLMINEYEADDSISIRKFYIRRFFRIIPAMLVYVVISIFFLLLINNAINLNELSAVVLFYSNYYSITPGFSGGAFPSPLSILWSLSVEEHYYFIFPFVFYMLAGAWRKFIIYLCLIAFAILVWRLYLVYVVGLDSLPYYRVYKATDTRFDSILYGAFLALIIRRERVFSFLNNNISFAVGFLLILFSLLFRDESFRESFRYSIQGVALVFLFIPLIFSSGMVSRVLQTAFFRFVGKISYSLYLYHWLAFGLVNNYLGAEPLLIRITVLLALSFLLAYLSYRFIESPMLKYRKKFA